MSWRVTILSVTSSNTNYASCIFTLTKIPSLFPRYSTYTVLLCFYLCLPTSLFLYFKCQFRQEAHKQLKLLLIVYICQKISVSSSCFALKFIFILFNQIERVVVVVVVRQMKQAKMGMGTSTFIIRWINFLTMVCVSSFKNLLNFCSFYIWFFVSQISFLVALSSDPFLCMLHILIYCHYLVSWVVMGLFSVPLVMYFATVLFVVGFLAFEFVCCLLGPFLYNILMH